MPLAKQVADFLTISRALLALGLAWLGLTRQEESWTLAAWILIAAWTSDSLDGPLARGSGARSQTWMGDHDLQVDMTVAGGLLFYMAVSGLVDFLVAIVYALLWTLIFIYWGIPRALGMLVQAPIYGWFIWMSLQRLPLMGLGMVMWIMAAMVVTWPKFPREVVPGFLKGMGEVLERDQGGDGGE